MTYKYNFASDWFVENERTVELNTMAELVEFMNSFINPKTNKPYSVIVHPNNTITIYDDYIE